MVLHHVQSHRQIFSVVVNFDQHLEMATQRCMTVLFLTGLVQTTDALTCYMCPRTGGRTLDDANIECLSMGWELSCSPQQDRCYSTNYPDDLVVMKGCTTSQSCVENTACCEGSYCNADPQMSKTGIDQQCADLDDCIQGSDVMMCARNQPTDSTKSCLCKANSYQRGFICQRKSFPDERCSVTSHCYDVSSHCISGMCKCPSGMFANDTTCSQQMNLGQSCSRNKECAGANTQCADLFCACSFGFVTVNGTNDCSGAHSVVVWSDWSWLIVLWNIDVLLIWKALRY